MEEDFKNAFTKTSEAIEAILVLSLSLLIFCGKGVVKGLEAMKSNLQDSSKWMVPGKGADNSHV